MSDLIIFPHCDLHVVRNIAPAKRLKIKIYDRAIAADKLSYVLTDVTNRCTFTFFSPYKAVGSRLSSLVNIDPSTGLVTPTELGITFVNIQFNTSYIIARIQVHDHIEGWWFGTPGLIVPKDDQIPHTQVSIYAQFSDDPSIAPAGGGKCDRVGDITGHGYVDLSSSAPLTLTVNSTKEDRLQGLQEGTATLTGSFSGDSQQIPVKVVDFGRQRNAERVRYKGNPSEKHNILFLAEGFPASERDKFDKLVTEVTDKLLDAKRHSPYNLLKNSFNVWKIFEPSEQTAVTCGFRVNDEDISYNSEVVLAKGSPIPYNGSLPGDQPTSNYTVEGLVRIVGLPLRGETRSIADLKTLWASQSLSGFDATKVTDKIVEVWRKQTSLGILEERNTFFGLYLGSRYADSERFRVRGDESLTPPANDTSTDTNLANFIKRIYQWFNPEPSRSLTPDPRKHPPELHQYNSENLGNSFLRYIGALRDSGSSTTNVGREWLPDPTGSQFIKSRGLIALITYEAILGGTNFNALTITATSGGRGGNVEFEYQQTATKKIMRRTPNPTLNTTEILDTIAHEFGHSFNLDDEYEDFAGDRPDASQNYDNTTPLSQINLDSNYQTNRRLDPEKVKWFDLVRLKISDALVRDSDINGSQIKVYIAKDKLNQWREAKQQNLEATLRDMTPDSRGKQLPVRFDEAHYLTELTIAQIEEVDATTGAITLNSSSGPFPANSFKKGAQILIPLRDAAGKLQFIVEDPVLQHLKTAHLPLNVDPDTSRVNKEADYPGTIAGFEPPCDPYKLIGVYEGAQYYTGMVYRATGQCKMRSSPESSTGEGEFCFLCKYLIVNRVDASLLAKLDEEYPKRKKKKEKKKG